MIIGITGSIATGKSTVSSYLKKNGYKLIDLDDISHQVIFQEQVVNEIKQLFPQGIVENGVVDRQKLSALVFSNSEYRLLLNKITHPIIIATMQQQISLANDKLIFVDIPLLFETKMEKYVDKIIVVYAPLDEQVKRLMKRDNIYIESAMKKIDSQMSIEDKKAKADYIIDNSLSIEKTNQQINRIIKLLEEGEKL